MSSKYTGPRVVRRCIACGWISQPCITPDTAAYALRRHSCAKHRAAQQKAQRHAERMAAIDRTPKPCLHKKARHQHGTYACYSLDGCRCAPCGAAQRDYEKNRVRQKAYGRWHNLVDAEPIRAHVRALQAHSMGLKTIASVSGVAHGALWKLMYGKKQPDGTCVPSARVRMDTADKILSIDEPVLAGGALVDATGTVRRVQALMAIGWSGQKLADRLGVQRGNFTLMNGADLVTEAKRRAISDLYDELWDTPPPHDDHRSRISYNRTLAFARRNGWVPPMAWDDDTIDDPAARPSIGAAQTATKQRAVLELIDLGVTLSEIERRVHANRDDIGIMLRRAGRGDDYQRLRLPAAAS